MPFGHSPYSYGRCNSTAIAAYRLKRIFLGQRCSKFRRPIFTSGYCKQNNSNGFLNVISITRTGAQWQTPELSFIFRVKIMWESCREVVSWLWHSLTFSIVSAGGFGMVDFIVLQWTIILSTSIQAAFCKLVQLKLRVDLLTLFCRSGFWREFI